MKRKGSITTLSLLNAEGGLFPQMLVFKGVRDQRVHEEVAQYDEWFQLHTVQENSWTDAYVLLEWNVRVWSHIARETDGHKLLILDSYPLHENLEEFLSEYDTHVLYVPKGMTWSLQPLDCGFFKIFKEEIQKDWVLNQQYKEYANESEKRRTIVTILKDVFEKLYDKSHIAFWAKAGLLYPEDRIRAIEEGAQRDATQDTAMTIEEEGHDNLFAD